MTITSSGPLCDVCGHYIFGVFGSDDEMENFKITGIENMLQCHIRCKEPLVKAMEAKDYKLLPIGPLRKVFEEHEATREKPV